MQWLYSAKETWNKKWTWDCDQLPWCYHPLIEVEIKCVLILNEKKAGTNGIKQLYLYLFNKGLLSSKYVSCTELCIFQVECAYLSKDCNKTVEGYLPVLWCSLQMPWALASQAQTPRMLIRTQMHRQMGRDSRLSSYELRCMFMHFIHAVHLFLMQGCK